MRAWFLVLLLVPLAGCLDEPDDARFQTADAGPHPPADDIIEKHKASKLWEVGWEPVETYRYTMGAMEPARNETLTLGPEHVPYRVHIRFYAACPVPPPTPMQSHVRFPAGFVHEYDWTTLYLQACTDDPTGTNYDYGFHVLVPRPCFTGDWTLSLEEGTIAGGLEVILMKPSDPEQARLVLEKEAAEDGDPCDDGPQDS